MYVHLYSTYTMRMFLQKVNIGAPAWLQNPTVVTCNWSADAKLEIRYERRHAGFSQNLPLLFISLLLSETVVEMLVSHRIYTATFYFLAIIRYSSWNAGFSQDLCCYFFIFLLLSDTVIRYRNAGFYDYISQLSFPFF